MDLKRCSKCGYEYPITEFYKNNATNDKLDYYCKTCRKQLSKKQNRKGMKSIYNDNRKFLESLKSPCEKCGESRPWVIQFHHIDPKTKSFSPSLVGTRSKQTISTEVSKCVCLCSNCHDEFHYFYGSRPDDPVAALREYLDR